MMWGCFCGSIQGSIIPVKGDEESRRGGVTARRYIEILEEALPWFLHEMGGVEHVLFMQDNAPIHKAKIVGDWLRENDVQVMVWPPYSPDLNPIEHVWAKLKRMLHKWYPELEEMAGGVPVVRESIEKAVTHCWQHLDPEYLRKLARGMPRRVQAVLKAKGWYTRY